jgi:1,2-dihydroxy-3-keto-5-methylthiopentene dioxygenase
MGYKNRDEVFIAPDNMPNYADKVRMFYEEHIHEDDEIRLVLKGGGFFDVRGHGDEWIRIRVTPGDFLVLPAGIYHRYGVDVSEFAHVMRLFAEAPKWVAVPRPCEDNAVRAAYRLKHLRPGGPVPKTALGPCDPAAYTYHIQHPAGADDTLAPVMRDVAEGRTACAVVYVTGAHNPNTHQSWCPDCITADPVVKAQVSAARESSARPVAFVHATVQRTSYLRNPAYPLRHHPLLRVRAIPTVIVFKAEGNGTDVVVSERLDGEVPASWTLQC